MIDNKVSKNDLAWIENAVKIAEDHDSNGKYSIVALAVKGNRVLAIGKNDYLKKGKAKSELYDYKSIHAELAAIVKILKDHHDEKNITLYIGGYVSSDSKRRKTRKMNTTKPCPVCQRLIFETKQVRKVVFMEDGEVEKWLVKR